MQREVQISILILISIVTLIFDQCTTETTIAPELGFTLGLDQSIDTINPASSRALRIKSGSSSLFGLLYLAAGEGPHSTVIFLNGFPGFERNQDIAQELRRNGWNTFSFNYRGSWGSEGYFSYENCIQDVHAVIQHLKLNQNVSKYRIDTTRFVLIGNSFGGGVALNYLMEFDSNVKEVILLSSFNMGGFANYLEETAQLDQYAAYLTEKKQINFSEVEDYVAEILKLKKQFNYELYCSTFSGKELFIIDENDKHKTFAECLKPTGTVISYTILDTDHNFSSHRIKLIRLILSWLSERKFN